ncbi:hypothetical protein [Nocardia sp. NPDC050710]|uniref:hypothetical protein n=1 Tax=Nocardia sp. NPDC050710 TaxID=3157220 RepID=UPI0033DCDD47
MSATLPDPVAIATVLLLLSAVTGGIDVVLIHLVVLRLHSRPETFYEHQLHTVHAAMAVVAVTLLFLVNLGGLGLWLATAVVLGWFAVEVADMLAEKNSRATLGGLPSYEYALHLVTSGLRFAFIALMLAAKPTAAWSLSAPTLLAEPHPMWVRAATLLVIVPGVLIVAVHLWLMRPEFRMSAVPAAHP